MVYHSVGGLYYTLCLWLSVSICASHMNIHYCVYFIQNHGPLYVECFLRITELKKITIKLIEIIYLSKIDMSKLLLILRKKISTTHNNFLYLLFLNAHYSLFCVCVSFTTTLFAAEMKNIAGAIKDDKETSVTPTSICSDNNISKRMTMA